MENLSTKSSLYDPLNNYLFFKIFGEKGDEIQLLGFINAVLGKTGDNMFTSVEILENTSYMTEIMGGKSCTLDVRAKLPDGAMVNIEVQVNDEYNMNRRSLFYLTREYSRSLKAGDDYVDLPDLIAINIVNYNYPKTRHFHSCFHLREDTEHDIMLSNALEIHYINMVRYRKQKKHLDLKDPLNRWLAWFDKNSPQELREEVVNMDAAIKTADEKAFNLATMSEDDIDYWFRRKLFKMDRAAELRNREREIARNMLKEGAAQEFRGYPIFCVNRNSIFHYLLKIQISSCILGRIP